MPLLSAAQIAARLNVTPTTIRRHANQHNIGEKVGETRVFSEADIPRLKALCREKAGNPNFVPGNHFGQPPKISKKKQKK